MIKLIKRKYLNTTYICQLFIEAKTKEDTLFDIRLRVRKNIYGQRQKVKIYLRIGIGRNITSNISRGGAIAPIIPFLQSNFKDNWKEIKNKLETLCKTFPTRFESLYSHSLDALGIDSDGKMGLFEVNTYPGQHFFIQKTQKYE